MLLILIKNWLKHIINLIIRLLDVTNTFGFFLPRNVIYVLAYHDIQVDETDYCRGLQITTSIKSFQNHITILSKYFKFISLKDACAQISQKKTLGQQVVITFDDGFHGVYENAYPILRDHNIPATLFLCSCAINNKDYIWINKITYILNKIGADAFLNSKYAISIPVKNILDIDQIISFFINNIHNMEFKDVIDKYYNKLNSGHNDTVYLNWSELFAMDDDLISYGSHTVNHFVLSKLPAERKQKEIVDAHQYLKEKLGDRLFGFAIPFGKQEDFDRHSEQIVKQNTGKEIFYSYGGGNFSRSPVDKLVRIIVAEYSSVDLLRILFIYSYSSFFKFHIRNIFSCRI